MSDQFTTTSMNKMIATEFTHIEEDARAEVFVAHREPTLEEAQKVVGGLVEMVSIHNMFGKEIQILVNEEGAFSLPQNTLATVLTGNIIYGPALLLTGDNRWD